MSDEVKVQVVIGLMGPKGSGKDTVADISIEKMGAVGKIATAAFLKQMCSRCLRLSPELFTSEKDKPFPRPFHFKGIHVRAILDEMDRVLSEDIKRQYGLKFRRVGVQNYADRMFNTPRELLQFVGTEMIQSIFKQFHCVVAYDQIRGNPGVWFVTDLRFLHEDDYAKSVFPLFYPVRIKGRAEVDDGKEEHASESEWKKIKPFAVIENTGSQEDLAKKASNVFKEIQADVKKRMSSLTPQDWQKMTCPPVVTASKAQVGETTVSSNNPNISFVFQKKEDIVDPTPRDL